MARATTCSPRRACRRAVGAAILTLCCSCEAPPPALHPLSASSAQRRWEPRLLGTWTKRHGARSTASDSGGGDSNDERFVITRSGYYRYQVSGVLGELTAYVVPLEGVDILDVVPEGEGPALWQPVHVFVRLWLEGDRLRYGWVAQSRWEEELRRHGAPVVHTPLEELFLINGTDSLRTLFEALLADSTVDWEMDSLTRDPSVRQP